MSDDEVRRPEDLEPPPRVDNIVFDQDVWHPLDHRFGSRRCRSFQKTPRRALRTHWRYQWDFGPWRSRMAWWHRITRCWWGRHSYSTMWRAGPNQEMIFHSRMCSWCDAPDPNLITQERITDP